VQPIIDVGGQGKEGENDHRDDDDKLGEQSQIAEQSHGEKFLPAR
jgi:hypothetical protein